MLRLLEAYFEKYVFFWNSYTQYTYQYGIGILYINIYCGIEQYTQ